ncbi:MAG: hypothetical protein HN794_00650 [Euryarchaeota archaeon]|jgi:hypothetical protein|nr:hypothetical protein [Euryarchaeota archaeon]MBT7459537.1 hypothetical protein [Euryarchaeota archaeon]
MGENRGKEILTKMSGNYISHFMSSGLMVLLFLLAVSWLSYSTSDYSFRQDNYQLEIAYILTSLISLGWMMSMIVGISFDLFPLTHNLDSYNQTHSTHYLFINIIGQVLIIAGIFSNNLQLLFEMSTIGMVLLCWGIISIAWPSWKLHRNSVNNNINCGNVALIPSVLIPASCLVILSCWIFRQTTGMLEFGLAFNVIVMMGTISLTLILAHFNRRLSWDVVKFSYFRPVVAIYLGLAILHSFASMWYARGDVSQTIFEYTLAAPLLWGFISTRPLKTIKNAIGSIQKPHSRLIGTAQWFFLVTGIMAIIPDFYPGKFTNITYVGFMFSCAVLSTWGSGIYLHQDHLHKSIHNRPGLWSIIIINAIGIMSLFLIGFKVTIFGDSSDLVYFFMRSLSLGAMIICIFILLIRDLFFSMDTWHRVPMSLDRYIS